MIVRREGDPTLPGVVSVGSFHAGQASNVIPDRAELRGTFRSVRAEQRDEIGRRITEIATGIAASMRGTAGVRLEWGGPPVVNDPAMTAIVQAAAGAVVGPDNVIDGPLLSVSDDVAEMLQRVPGCYFFVGSRNEASGLIWGHHHARFDIDEDAMAIGMETMTRAVLTFLADGA